MTNLEIAHQRLHNQLVTQQTFEKVDDVVRWLCAVQAQDYAAAKWALGLRMQNPTDDIIEQAFNDGTILRTHVMRPTWHFVLPADIRWHVSRAYRSARYRSEYLLLPHPCPGMILFLQSVTQRWQKHCKVAKQLNRA